MKGVRLSKLYLSPLLLLAVLCSQYVESSEISAHNLLLRGGSSYDFRGPTLSGRSPGRLQRGPLQGKQSQFTHQQQQEPMKEPEKEDTATAKEVMDAFLTRDSRNTFIARVYSILAGQLIVTAASVLLFGLNPSVSTWMRHSGLGKTVPWISLILSTICWVFMCTADNAARRKSPLKWKILTLFTIGEAISVGFISSFYQFRSVCTAMIATAVAATSVSLYTATQKNANYDLSQWGAGLSSCGLIFLAYGVLQLLELVGVLPPGFLPFNDMIYSLMGACLFSFYLAYHTKLIVSGKHTKYQMNEKDYVFGAMTLYNDLINMFIYILRLVGEDREH